MLPVDEMDHGRVGDGRDNAAVNDSVIALIFRIKSRAAANSVTDGLEDQSKADIIESTTRKTGIM
jgi:hypothetical protein